MSIRATSQTHLLHVGKYVRAVSHWIFQSFGFDSWRFHHYLHTTGSVVAGPAALVALFPRQVWTKTMDIYVPKSTAGDLLYFLQKEGHYRPMFGPFYLAPDFQRTHLFGYLPLASSSTKKNITVYIAESSALFPLIGNKSTMEMNLITG